MTQFSTWIPAVAVLVLAAPSFAAGLGPRSSSQLVTAYGDGATACRPSTFVAPPNDFGFDDIWQQGVEVIDQTYSRIDTISDPSGSRSPFFVPAGQDFVVTSYDWSVSSENLCSPELPQAASCSRALRVFVFGQEGLSLQSQAVAMADLGGFTGGNVVIPNGIVARAGTVLCYSPRNATVIAHGYFTKTKEEAAPAVCGNNVAEEGEHCDGADFGNCAYGCVDCASCAPAPVCGNDVKEYGERCDGADRGSCSFGCANDCTCNPYLPVCGNNILDDGEQCDRYQTGNCISPCSAACTCTAPPAVCGNGIVEAGEGCEAASGCDMGLCLNCQCETP